MIVSVCLNITKFLSDYFRPTEWLYETTLADRKPWYEHNESLKISIPLLDALIIPNAAPECKVILGLFATSPIFFICHIVSQQCNPHLVLKYSYESE